MTRIQKRFSQHYYFNRKRRISGDSGGGTEEAFIFSVDALDDGKMTIYVNTDNTQSFKVDWGDGTVDENVGGNIAHEYDVNDIYDISITGDFELKFMDSTTYSAKVREVKNWGITKFRTMYGFFGKCKSMTIVATDAPDLSVCTSTSNMFYQCYLFNSSINHWDLSNIGNMSSMFYYAKLYNQETIINGASCTVYTGMFKQCEALNSDVTIVNNTSPTLLNMFYNAFAFDAKFTINFVNNMNILGLFRFCDMSTTDVSNYDFSKVYNLDYFIDGTELSTENYSKLLIAMDSAITLDNETFYATDIKYNEEGNVGRQSLIDNRGWTFEDGGVS